MNDNTQAGVTYFEIDIFSDFLKKDPRVMIQRLKACIFLKSLSYIDNFRTCNIDNFRTSEFVN